MTIFVVAFFIYLVAFICVICCWNDTRPTKKLQNLHCHICLLIYVYLRRCKSGSMVRFFRLWMSIKAKKTQSNAQEHREWKKAAETNGQVQCGDWICVSFRQSIPLNINIAIDDGSNSMLKAINCDQCYTPIHSSILANKSNAAVGDRLLDFVHLMCIMSFSTFSFQLDHYSDWQTSLFLPFISFDLVDFLNGIHKS